MTDMPCEDRGALLEGLERDFQEEWIPWMEDSQFSEGNNNEE
jgi:hypothetical protein